MNTTVKRILSGALASLTLLGLTACGAQSSSAAPQTGSSSQAAASDEVIELTFWYSFGGTSQECNENLTQKFNETVGKELGIHVTAEYQGSYNETASKLQAAAAAGTMPDVSVIGTTSMGIFLDNGLLEPLNTYVERDLDVDDFFPGLLKNTVKDDVWYGVPYLCSTPILYLNTTLLEQAGLDPAGPKTWDELADYCKTVKEKTGAYGLSCFSYDWFMEAFLLEHGVSILNEDETATNFDSPETREILTYFKDLLDGGYIRWAASADEGSGQITADYTNQTCAMWFGSTAGLSATLQVAQENGFEVNTCYMPAAKSYGVPIGGSSLVMFTTVPEEKKEAAWQFIQFMTDTEQTAYASELTGYVPLRASAEQEENLVALYAEYPQYKVALDQLRDYSTGRPLNPSYVECTYVMMGAMDSIMINGADMDETLAQSAEKINQLLNQ